VVVDEADTMYEFGTGFAPLVRDILFAIQKRREVSSTIASPRKTKAQFICARYCTSLCVCRFTYDCSLRFRNVDGWVLIFVLIQK